MSIKKMQFETSHISVVHLLMVRIVYFFQTIIFKMIKPKYITTEGGVVIKLHFKTEEIERIYPSGGDKIYANEINKYITCYNYISFYSKKNAINYIKKEIVK